MGKGDFQKRPTYVERDLHMWKETYTRDLQIWGKQIYKRDPQMWKERPTKETYIHGKRLTNRLILTMGLTNK